MLKLDLRKDFELKIIEGKEFFPLQDYNYICGKSKIIFNICKRVVAIKNTFIYNYQARFFLGAIKPSKFSKNSGAFRRKLSQNLIRYGKKQTIFQKAFRVFRPER